MKSVLMAMAFIIGGIAFGQQQNTTSPDLRADKVTEKMATKLGLTPDQKAKISDINRGIAKKNDGIRQTSQFTPEQKHEIVMSNYEAAKSMYKGVLTAEQYAKFEQMEKTRMEAKKNANNPSPTEELDNM